MKPWVIVKDPGTDSEEIWSEHIEYSSAVEELKAARKKYHSFDIMKRLPDSSLTTEY